MGPERVVKMKHEFDATVRQDSFPACIEDRLVTFLRPDAFDKGSKSRVYLILSQTNGGVFHYGSICH
jgi:hypothetical protein